MDLPNETYSDVMLNCVHLGVINPRLWNQLVFVAFIFYPYSISKKLRLVGQLFWSMAAGVDYRVFFWLNSWLSRALSPIC